MTPAERRAEIRREHAELIAAVVADAPPLSDDAVDLLRALRFPVAQQADA